MTVSTFSLGVRLRLVAISSYSRRKSSSGSPTRPEKNGALCERAAGMAAGPVAGLAAICLGAAITAGGCTGAAGAVVEVGAREDAVTIGAEEGAVTGAVVMGIGRDEGDDAAVEGATEDTVVGVMRLKVEEEATDARLGPRAEEAVADEVGGSGRGFCGLESDLALVGTTREVD